MKLEMGIETVDELELTLSWKINYRFKELETLIEESLDPGRARNLSLTKLEEACMWIEKAIRDDQEKKKQ